MKWVLSIIQGLLAVGFIMFGLMKLGGSADQVEAFRDVYKYGVGFMYVTGAIELLAAIGLISGFWRKQIGIGASAVLSVIMLGAILTHFIAGQGFGVAATPLVLLILNLVLLWGWRKQLKKG
ncbi:DoxX family protein [Paenibacillus xylanexedens]|uniref:DoxX family protein n=1 Tax=Paenibacillus xylanexedens TaxID=528191 RepID=UPI00119FDBB8|nr:DoxX family protein [Paenibacillus xylanexedens]